MQGWFRMPHDSIAGGWWSLIMPMTNTEMQLLSNLRLRKNRVRIADEVGEIQWDPWEGEHEHFFVAHPDEADASDSD